MYKYYVLNKPFGFLSQFTKEVHDHKVLGDLFPFPNDVYAVGRLDRDSEGIIILTNDKSVNSKLLKPENEHRRLYWVQVEGTITKADLAKLNGGITIKLKSKSYKTLPVKTTMLSNPKVWDRDPPIRERKAIPTSWATIELFEGKNRQVRKMFAAIGFPVLRLIRHSIEDLTIQNLENGKVLEMSKTKLFNKLNIN